MMNNYLDDYANMLNNFRTNDLSLLLAAFGRNKAGRKSELKDRALELLRSRSSATFNHQSYLSKISEISRSMQSELPNNNEAMRLMHTQQRQQHQMMAMGNIQIPQQRMYHQPQYAQPMQMITRAGLPPAMPQMQRNMYGNTVGANSIQGNSMTSNNIQYLSRNYQMAGPRTIASQFPSGQKMNVGITQQAYDMNATPVENPYIPPSQVFSNITFKKLPFYDVYNILIRPSVLNSIERCTLQNTPRGMREATFKLNLSAEQATMVGMNRDVYNGKNEYVYQYQIRICQLEPGVMEVSDFMPLGLHVRVNGKANPLPPTAPNTRPGTETRRTSRPINCTQLMKNSPIVQNIITINWAPDQKTYAMGIFLVKKLTTDTLIQKLIDKGATSSEDTRNNIIKNLAVVDPDLATTSYRFSLVCPLGKMRMTIPAKSIHCEHLQCFDASTFLLMNEKKPSWLCPTCNKPCLYDDIVIQNYFLEVVTSPTLTDSITEIVILADGSWVVYDDKNDTNHTTNTPAKLEILESVILDSDDEESVEEKKDSKPESSKPQEPTNLKSSFIDLTINDDEQLQLQKSQQENEALAADNVQESSVELKPQAQVQPQQSVTSSEQGVVIEIDSPSPPTSPTPTSPTTSPTPTSPTPTSEAS